MALNAPRVPRQRSADPREGLQADAETVASVEAEVVAKLAVEVLFPVELHGGPTQRGRGAAPAGFVGVEKSGLAAQRLVVLCDGGDGAVLLHHADYLVPYLTCLLAVGSGAEGP